MLSQIRKEKERWARVSNLFYMTKQRYNLAVIAPWQPSHPDWLIWVELDQSGPIHSHCPDQQGHYRLAIRWTLAMLKKKEKQINVSYLCGTWLICLNFWFKKIKVLFLAHLKVIWSIGNTGSSPYSKNKWKVFLKLLTMKCRCLVAWSGIKLTNS